MNLRYKSVSTFFFLYGVPLSSYEMEIKDHIF